MIEIVEKKSKKELKEFINFPDGLYKGCPYYIPEMKGDELEALRSDVNPAFEYCEARYFMAYKDGAPAGRIAAIISNGANQYWNTRRMRFSRVDFIDDYEVSAALFGAVEGWARERGLNEIHGPIGFCDMDKEGMLVEGFDRLSMSITIYNYPYYKDHLARLGYGKDVDWLEKIIKVPKQGDPSIDKLNRLSEAVLKRNKLRLYGIKHINEAKPIVIQLFELLNSCYTNLYGVVPFTPALAQYYFNKFKLLLDPDYAKFVVNEKDELVGFGLAAPSMSLALRKCNGNLFPFGFIPVLYSLKHAKVVDLYLIGVRPEYQNTGVPAILLDAVVKSAMKNGIEYAETGPELESNSKVQSLWKYFEYEEVRRRRCFIKNLDGAID